MEKLDFIENLYLELCIDFRIRELKEFIDRFQCDSILQNAIKHDKEELQYLNRIKDKLFKENNNG